MKGIIGAVSRYAVFEKYMVEKKYSFKIIIFYIELLGNLTAIQRQQLEHCLCCKEQETLIQSTAVPIPHYNNT